MPVVAREESVPLGLLVPLDRLDPLDPLVRPGQSGQVELPVFQAQLE